jgi:hypothetical protein
MNTNRSYKIVGGPSRDTIFDACKYACDERVSIPVEFKVAIAFTAPPDDPGCTYIEMGMTDVVITGISLEDGSGSSFNIEGSCKADLSSFSTKHDFKSYRFKAWYNTKKREGTIRFE